MCSSLWAILLHMPIPTFHTSWHLKIRTHTDRIDRHCLQHILPPDIYSSLIKSHYSWEAFWMLAASSHPFLFSFVINPNMKWRWILVFDSWTTVMGHPSKLPESQMLLQSATKTAALPVHLHWISVARLCPWSLSLLPLGPPVAAAFSNHIYRLKLKIKIFTSVLILGETNFRSCEEHLVLKWLFREYLINSGFMGVPVMGNA